jgi:hypothetical protein
MNTFSNQSVAFKDPTVVEETSPLAIVRLTMPRISKYILALCLRRLRYSCIKRLNTSKQV